MITKEKKQATVQHQDTVTVEAFARDLWETLRGEIREQLGNDSGLDFEKSIPAWEQLEPEAREVKVLVARNELVRLVNRAGYEIRRRPKAAVPQG